MSPDTPKITNIAWWELIYYYFIQVFSTLFCFVCVFKRYKVWNNTNPSKLVCIAFGLFCHTVLSICISTIRSAQQHNCLSLVSAGVKYMTFLKKNHVMGCSHVQINPVTVCSSAYNLQNSVSPAMCLLRHRDLEFNW